MGLLASLLRSRRRLTVVLVNPLKTSRPRLLRRLSRRNEMMSRGNISQLFSIFQKGVNLIFTLIVHNLGLRNSGNFLFTVAFPKLACTSIAKNFAGYSLHCDI